MTDFSRSIIISNDIFSGVTQLQESQNRPSTFGTVEISVPSREDYIKYSEVLEGKSFIINDNGISYVVEDGYAVKVGGN